MEEHAPGHIAVYRTDFGGSRVKANKAELIKLLEIEYSYFCPSSRMLSTEMLKGIVAGHKRLLKKNVVIKCYRYELYPELSIEQVHAFARQRIPDFDAYLPDEPTSAKIERRYLLDLVNSLIPNSMEDRRKEAIRRSKAGNRPNDQDQLQILLAPEFRNLFTNPLIPLGRYILRKVVLSDF